MRLLSWNLNGRVKCLEKQLKALARRNCDLLALQEVKENTASLLREGLRRLGLTYAVDSFELAPEPGLFTGPRRYGELIASRCPLKSLSPSTFDIPWPERVLSAVVAGPAGKFELHTTHIPAGRSHDEIKTDTIDGIYARLACHSKTPRILCGDFNTPKEEKADGTIVTWGKKGSGWDLSERKVLEGLGGFDLIDIYRHRHGYRKQAFSYYPRPHIGRRFDLAFASRSLLDGVECAYVHSVRKSGLSDHSALVIDFALGPRPDTTV